MMFSLSMKQVLLYDCVSADESPAICVCDCVCRQKRNSQGFWLSPFYLKLMIATIVPMLIKSLNAFLVVFKEKSTCVVPFFILSYTDRPKLLLQYFMGEVWPDIYKKSQGDGEWEGLSKYELRDIFFCYGIYFDISWHKDLWLTFV